MDKFLSGFIKVKKSVQIFTLVGIMLFLSYLGSVSYRGDRAFSNDITNNTAVESTLASGNGEWR